MAPTGALTANPTAKERIGSSAELQTALACVGRAVPPGTGTPFNVILARFGGDASFLAFFYGGPGATGAPTTVVVWIVNGQTCTASGSTSAHS